MRGEIISISGRRSLSLQTDARTLSDALESADVLIGVSRPGLVTREMIKSMNDSPAVFPLSNPVSEIMPRRGDEGKR